MSDAVERLRQAARRPGFGLVTTDLAAVTGTLAHIADLKAQRDAAHAAGVAEERARVVAWLRNGAFYRPPSPPNVALFNKIADAFEAGQHERTDDVA